MLRYDMYYYVILCPEDCFLYPLLSYAMSCYARLCLAMLREIMQCPAKNVLHAMLGMVMLFRRNVCYITPRYGRRMVMLYSVMVSYVVVMAQLDTQWLVI